MSAFQKQIELTNAKVNAFKLKQKELAISRRIESKKKRLDDERRVLLAGAAVLAFVASGEMDGDQFRRMMDQHLSRSNDRDLFDLDSEGK